MRVLVFMHACTCVWMRVCVCVTKFGHLFAKGGTRQAALRSLAVALRDVVVRGEIRTIVDYALDMLQVRYTHTHTHTHECTNVHFALISLPVSHARVC